MADNNLGKSRKQELDDFWDLEGLLPERKRMSKPSGKSVDTVELTLGEKTEATANHTVYSSQPLHSIEGMGTRYIPPHHPVRERDVEEAELEYLPKSSLIHKVRIFRWRTSYRYYEEFLETGKLLWEKEGEPCPYASFFSYVPQYNQLSQEQMQTYLHFRTCIRRGEYPKVDFSYVLLLIFELINLGDLQDVSITRDSLASIWIAYRRIFPRLESQLAEWICDFCLLHQLSPPDSMRNSSAVVSCTLKEFYVGSADNDMQAYANALLVFSSSYDYHTSKFCTGEGKMLFDQHIPRAFCRVLAAVSEEGKLFSRIALGDSQLTRDAFSGALASYLIKRRLEISYCSFSRTNELRYLVGDIVRYSENKIRAVLGIKSRLSCYSLSPEVKGILDQYFQNELSGVKHTSGKKEEKASYEVLYDLTPKPLSLIDAKRIEEESWDTTRNLVETFEEGISDLSESLVMEQIDESESETDEDECLQKVLQPYMPFLSAVYHNDKVRQKNICAEFGKLIDTFVDEINACCADCIGDILLEEGEDGWQIVVDYVPLLWNDGGKESCRI